LASEFVCFFDVFSKSINMKFTARFHTTKLNTSAFGCDNVSSVVQFELIDAADVVDV